MLPVAPNRPAHPEIPMDSFFGIPMSDKPHEILVKEEMGLRFSLETKLNLASTEDCLKSNDWDWDLAMADFLRVKAQGKIGPHQLLQLP